MREPINDNPNRRSMLPNVSESRIIPLEEKKLMLAAYFIKSWNRLYYRETAERSKIAASALYKTNQGLPYIISSVISAG